MEFKFIKYEKRGHLAYITFNRPEVMNALHPPCHLEMDQVWDDFAADREMWVAILTGSGERAFSAGNDLKWTAEHRGERPQMSKGGFAGITSRFDLTKPIIAAVNGFALGGGCEIALACDIIIAADHARLGLPEPRVGLMAGRRRSPSAAAPHPAQDRDGHDSYRQTPERGGGPSMGPGERSRATEGPDGDGGAMGR